jgi:hypothetical protein
MPDFEIRYFHDDGTLAIVHITSLATTIEAEGHAKQHQFDYAKFEVREMGAPARS